MAKTISMADLRGKSDEDLGSYITATTKELLEARFNNYTNQLADTSKIGKIRRDLARAQTIRNERARAAAKA
ncbi:MAG: 50S ribosomal protein L29 [Polyangiales bacterium]|jgi:large subunit ribosomal protein L29